MISAVDSDDDDVEGVAFKNNKCFLVLRPRVIAVRSNLYSCS